MLVMFHCYDKNNQQAKRNDALVPHLAWVEINMESIKVAGPLLQEETKNIIGSLYIIEADNIDNAKQIFQDDPYFKADIWQQIVTTEFKDYAGTWVGGKNWPTSSSN
ncbi:YciI family protein [Thalassotalea piscium]